MPRYVVELEFEIQAESQTEANIKALRLRDLHPDLQDATIAVGESAFQEGAEMKVVRPVPRRRLDPPSR
jgi:hypothetical protein